jgi:hypothetical protein
MHISQTSLEMKSPIRNSILLAIVILSNLQLLSQSENSVVVSADKMNVLYFGIENPISIAANGITNDKLNVSMTNGTIEGNKGNYIANPGSGPISVLEVSMVDESGKLKQISCDTFRVKKIPVPQACIGSNCSSSLYLTKDELLRNPELNISWNFPFDLDFKIISFSFSYVENKDFTSENVKGSEFTPGMIDVIKRMDGGSKIYLENIEAIGPNDEIRTLDPIVIKLADNG